MDAQADKSVEVHWARLNLDKDQDQDKDKDEEDKDKDDDNYQWVNDNDADDYHICVRVSGHVSSRCISSEMLMVTLDMIPLLTVATKEIFLAQIINDATSKRDSGLGTAYDDIA